MNTSSSRKAQDRENEFGWGAKAGVEYTFGRSPWAVGLEYRHLELLRAENTPDRDLYGDIGLNVASLALTYRVGRP
jgi:opacity protein-like surface antigen